MSLDYDVYGFYPFKLIITKQVPVIKLAFKCGLSKFQDIFLEVIFRILSQIERIRAFQEKPCLCRILIVDRLFLPEMSKLFPFDLILYNISVCFFDLAVCFETV